MVAIDATALLDNAWSAAFPRGDTQFLQCLLIPQFTQIVRSGGLKFLADELEMTANNRGKNLKIPELPKAVILLHDNVAVAYGVIPSLDPQGRPKARLADFYVWEDGQWHAFFAEQTPVATP